MTLETAQHKFYQKELEINALLEITQAVNNNLPEEDLYKIYEFTLRASLQVDRLVLCVKEEGWLCKVQFGTVNDFTQCSSLEALDLKEIVRLKEIDFDFPLFSEFEMVIPVLHKDRILAFVFLKSSGKPGSHVDTTFIQALSNIMLVAIENKRLARRELEQQAFQRDMEIAKNVQEYLFPKELPKNNKLEVKAFYQPCKTVGGDYYDYIPMGDDQFLVCVADVSGKGVPAAILMSNFQAILRTLTRKSRDPEEMVHELNYQLAKNASGENFITFFMAMYDYAASRLHYVNAGHNPPVIIDEDKSLTTLKSGTTILGAFDPLPFLNIGVLDNLQKFSLYLFTDGITETFNAGEEEYGLERLQKMLLGHSDHSLDAIHEQLMLDLDAFRGDRLFEDDLTFLSCRVNNVPA